MTHALTISVKVDSLTISWSLYVFENSFEMYSGLQTRVSVHRDAHALQINFLNVSAS